MQGCQQQRRLKLICGGLGLWLSGAALLPCRVAVASTDSSVTRHKHPSKKNTHHKARHDGASSTTKKTSGGAATNGKNAASSFSLPPTPQLVSVARLGPPPPLPDKYRGVAVLPPATLSVEPAFAEGLMQTLLNEIDEISGLQSISPEDVQNALKAYELDANACDRELPCVARAGRYARAQWALETVISGLGGTQDLSLRLIDTVNHRELGRMAESLSERLETRLLQIHRMAIAMLDAPNYVGDLLVQCSVAGAEVYLDDHLLGVTPLAMLPRVSAGLHIVRVSKVGFSDVHRFVDVTYKRTTTFKVDFSAADITAIIVENRSDSGFGSLFLIGTEAGIEIRIDGEPVGVTPLQSAITAVPGGPRRLSLRRAGHVSFIEEINITANQRTDLLMDTTANGTYTAVSLGNHSLDSRLPDLKQIRTLTRQSGLAFFNQPYFWRLPSGMLCAVGGGASLLVGAIYAIKVGETQSQANQVQRSQNGATWTLAQQSTYQAQLDKLNSDGPRYVHNEKIFFGVGLGLSSVGLGLLGWEFLAHHQLFGTPKKTAPAAPQPSSHALSLQAPPWQPQWQWVWQADRAGFAISSTF